MHLWSIWTIIMCITLAIISLLILHVYTHTSELSCFWVSMSSTWLSLTLFGSYAYDSCVRGLGIQIPYMFCSGLMSAWNWTISSSCMHAYILIYLPSKRFFLYCDSTLCIYMYMLWTWSTLLKPPFAAIYMSICCRLMTWSRLFTAMFLTPWFHICIYIYVNITELTFLSLTVHI